MSQVPTRSFVRFEAKSRRCAASCIKMANRTWIGPMSRKTRRTTHHRWSWVAAATSAATAAHRRITLSALRTPGIRRLGARSSGRSIPFGSSRSVGSTSVRARSGGVNSWSTPSSYGVGGQRS